MISAMMKNEIRRFGLVRMLGVLGVVVGSCLVGAEDSVSAGAEEVAAPYVSQLPAGEVTREQVYALPAEVLDAEVELATGQLLPRNLPCG